MLLANILPPTMLPQTAAPAPDSSTQTHISASTANTGRAANDSNTQPATQSAPMLTASDSDIVISVSALQDTKTSYDLARASALKVQRDLFFEGLIKSLETAVQKPDIPYDSLIIAPLSQAPDATAQPRETVILQRPYR